MPSIDAVQRRAASLARGHWLLWIMLAVGLVLRLITWLAYQPALLAIDSFGYIRNLETMRMDGFSPVGYNLILTALLAVGSPFSAGLAITTAVQHLVGLVVAILLYATARRIGARGWVSALITLPVLVDGYQLQIEQSVMSESWSALVLVGAVSVLLARMRRAEAGDVPAGPRWQAAAIAGVLLAGAVTIRLINIVAIVPFVAYLILVGAGRKDRKWWRVMLTRTTAGIAGFAVLLGVYVVAFRAQTGYWGLSGGRTPSIIYGRAATIADCDRLELDATLKRVCPKEPKEDRLGIDSYTHHPRYRLIDLPPGRSLEDVRNEFAWIVIREQPLEFVGTILRDFAKGFAWRRTTAPNDVPLARWQFQLDYPRWKATDANQVTQRYDGHDPRIVPALTTFLRSYQLTVGYVPGAILGLCGLLGLVPLLIRRSPHLASAAVLVTGTGFVLLFGAAIFEFSWRYQLPALLFFPLAAAIGFTAITSQRQAVDDEVGSKHASTTVIDGGEPRPRRSTDPPMINSGGTVVGEAPSGLDGRT